MVFIFSLLVFFYAFLLFQFNVQTFPMFLYCEKLENKWNVFEYAFRELYHQLVKTYNYVLQPIYASFNP